MDDSTKPERANRLPQQFSCTAFEGSRCIASGELEEVALKTKEAIDQGAVSVLIFDDQTAELIEIDFRGNVLDVLKRLSKINKPADTASEQYERGTRGPGRPKLGVVAREVTLLPRQWDWLNKQPGGASVALRRLVDEARKSSSTRQSNVRQSQEVAYKFMSAMAGNLEGFEEASRALFSSRQNKFDELIESWPGDISAHTKKLAAQSFIQADEFIQAESVKNFAEN